MFLEQVTPLILTYNESPNIGRALEQLRWALDIVVVDSFSNDNTDSIVQSFSQVRLFQRTFDSHERQWNYGLSETDIRSEWVLALDADYILTPEFIDELEQLTPASSTDGYSAKFVYCIYGRRLHASAYPPVTVLYRRTSAHYSQDGHTQRVIVKGAVQPLHAYILHDDRKDLGQWLWSQDRYGRLEAKKLTGSDEQQRGAADRIRSMRVVAPFFILFYCLFIKRAVLDGWPGVYYAFQRMLAELVLSLHLIEDRIRKRSHSERR